MKLAKSDPTELADVAQVARINRANIGPRAHTTSLTMTSMHRMHKALYPFQSKRLLHRALRTYDNEMHAAASTPVDSKASSESTQSWQRLPLQSKRARTSWQNTTQCEGSSHEGVHELCGIGIQR